MACTRTAESTALLPEALLSAGGVATLSNHERPYEPDVSDLAALVGHNIKRLRLRQGHSLERLAKLAGVSRAMISQIELSRSVPTIGLLAKLARALGVPFATLARDVHAGGTTIMRGGQARLLTSLDRQVTSRALFPTERARRVEFYKFMLAADATEHVAAHPAGTVENLVVQSGAIEIEIGGEVHGMATDDAILFEADVARTYRNVGGEPAVMYLVISYVDPTG